MKLDSFTMAEKNKDAEYFTPGNQVRLVTIGPKEVQGEVVAFDHHFNTLLIKSPSLGQHGRHDLQMINLDYVSHLEQKEDNGQATDPLPYVPVARVTNRTRQNITERKRQWNYVGENVSAEGQQLMDTISKTITDVKWESENIIVMDCVLITPPYTVSHLSLLPGKEQQQNQQTLNHLRKMVEKHQQDERSRLAHSHNDTRRSTSPSPAPSSSSTSSAS